MSPQACAWTTRTPESKQYHKEGRALRTDTPINDTRDFQIGKRLTNLPALCEVGFTANRRLLDVQRLSHDPARGHETFIATADPVITDTEIGRASCRERVCQYV